MNEWMNDLKIFFLYIFLYYILPLKSNATEGGEFGILWTLSKVTISGLSAFSLPALERFKLSCCQVLKEKELVAFIMAAPRKIFNNNLGCFKVSIQLEILPKPILKSLPKNVLGKNAIFSFLFVVFGSHTSFSSLSIKFFPFSLPLFSSLIISFCHFWFPYFFFLPLLLSSFLSSFPYLFPLFSSFYLWAIFVLN